jgi:hypothetical protein
VYLVYKSSEVSITQETTAGSVSPFGSASIEIVDTVTFTKSKQASLSKPPASGVTWKHVGGQSASLSVKGTTVTAGSPILAVYQATYMTTGLAYRLSGVSAVTGVPNVSVIVYIEGTTP